MSTHKHERRNSTSENTEVSGITDSSYSCLSDNEDEGGDNDDDISIGDCDNKSFRIQLLPEQRRDFDKE